MFSFFVADISHQNEKEKIDVLVCGKNILFLKGDPVWVGDIHRGKIMVV